ncbi:MULTISPECIES: UDP-N-acetylmuramoyl-L-alanyl-D-glutamate--2,6-diaminopimelate ligase [Ornithinibacillus]|jgi:UDP-N-acetylmuramoyl-L-alanyl-D-glutamate--2,6-diaminopimelate ligase|uniref:UDP-N-acetylmuramoyl-L-alanyl-D-glutamate--2, 6-diaminopimelate ligase n=1 Tax=Ornithinibacillus TaxID=484508 RepID=UPI00064D81A1|nr:MULTISPECIES: UDP-N-acetylmuramoyl-L-alanyl-D-glutamate--2,6-diaminopimelate ligase [Ornithinibacillus]
MKIEQLLDGIEILNNIKQETEELIIDGIAYSSSDININYVFVAIKGHNADGHDYIKDAINNGACLVVGEKEIDDLPIPYVQVDDSRKTLGILSRNFYRDPSKNKIMIGITGTNGKTTTSHLLKHILESNGKTCSLIGTIQNIINGEIKNSTNTTPSSLDLHKLIAESKDEVIIIEISSHGLTQHRVEGLAFDLCLFTNLEHEHLDYHKTMEEYFRTKMLLFDYLKEDGQAIINIDNYWGDELAKILDGQGKIVYSIGQKPKCKFNIINFNSKNSIVTIMDNKIESDIFSPMEGIHNMYNSVMAYGTSRIMGLESESILETIINFKGVRGRFEIYKLSNGATAVVDYAHTADAIFHCLRTANLKGAKRITHVFGFRGGRDLSKRQGMLSVTSELSTRYILTLDDLNSVSKNEMIRTLSYLNHSYGNEKGMIIGDRTMAIKWAIEHSQKGDWIVITGKGHEQYKQSFKLPTYFDTDTVLYVNDLFIRKALIE